MPSIAKRGIKLSHMSIRDDREAVIELVLDTAFEVTVSSLDELIISKIITT